jgi:hypothetical protein
MGEFTAPYGLRALGHQTLTCGTAAAGTVVTLPTDSIHGGTVRPALTRIVSTSGTVRFLGTGGTPSGTAGFPIYPGPGEVPTDYYDDPSRLKFIGVTAAGTVEIAYYG